MNSQNKSPKISQKNECEQFDDATLFGRPAHVKTHKVPFFLHLFKITSPSQLSFLVCLTTKFIFPKNRLVNA